MNELIEWLRKEANRNSQMQGEKKADGTKEHTCNRRRTFRHRAHQLNEAAVGLERLSTLESIEKGTAQSLLDALKKLETVSTEGAVKDEVLRRIYNQCEIEAVADRNSAFKYIGEIAIAAVSSRQATPCNQDVESKARACSDKGESGE